MQLLKVESPVYNAFVSSAAVTRQLAPIREREIDKAFLSQISFQSLVCVVDSIQLRGAERMESRRKEHT